MLKGKGILLFSIGAGEVATKTATVATRYGRIRTVQQGPDGALYFTTSNTDPKHPRADRVYRLTLAG